MKEPPEFSEYRRAFAYILPYWRRLTVILFISLISTLLGLVQPYIAKLLIDEALVRRSQRALFIVAGLMVIVSVFSFALNILSSYRYVAVSADVLFDMRLALYRHLQRLSPRFYARTKLGEIVSRINNDIAEVQRVAADTLLALLANAVFLIGSVVIMLWLNWRLFLLSIALVPMSIALLRHYQRRLTGQVRTVRERSADIGSFLIETLIGMRLVITSRAEATEIARFRQRNRSFIDALLAMQLTSYLAGAMPGAILTISTALVFLLGGRMVISGQMSIGALVAFMAYHLRLLAPVQSLMGLYANLATARVSLGRVFELLDTKPEVSEQANAIRLETARGEITFERVTFQHDRETEVLSEVSFTIPAGSVCAITGSSGVGKSTIADLMVRLFDPQSGAIRLDDYDLRELTLDAVRRHIVLVDQMPIIFNVTIAENIAYGRPDATRDEIAEAARAAALESFISRLPDGYDTQVGERGLALSAGERQRLALARALLRRPAVLVLDEPTAALDPATEQNFLTALSAHFHRLTVVLITHRLSLAVAADQVLVLEGGRIVDAGAPDELLAGGGALPALFNESSASDMRR
ncbi:MAG TPA: ABC transporter ATP-binding protein [Blastocatellia bacterium]|nr:ABC transporter ATP-binding protein [Blastocatellia bacterium]